MLKDFILVIAGIAVFMVLAILQKERRSQLKIDFLTHLSKLAVLSGLFVSIVKLVILIADLENLLGTDGKGISSISSTAFFIMITYQERISKIFLTTEFFATKLNALKKLLKLSETNNNRKVGIKI